MESLLTLMGRFFQIRDDYQNLYSNDVCIHEPLIQLLCTKNLFSVSAAKGALSDLDEDKYSFVLIQALNNTENKQLKSPLHLRSQRGVLTNTGTTGPSYETLIEVEQYALHTDSAESATGRDRK